MKRIESVFLTYANLDFRDQKTRKRQLGDLVLPLSVISGPRNVVQSRFDFLIQLLQFTDHAEAQRFIEAQRLIEDNPLSKIDRGHREVAFEALFAYREDFCESRCPLRNVREQMFSGDRWFQGQDRLRCLECDQVAFRHILHGISQSLSNDEIVGYKELTYEKYYELKQVPDRQTGEMRSRWDENTETRRYFQKERKLGSKVIFHFFIMARVLYSLETFMSGTFMSKDNPSGSSNRTRILLCRNCGKTFFVPERLKQDRDNVCKRCSGTTAQREWRQRTYGWNARKQPEYKINLYS